MYNKTKLSEIIDFYYGKNIGKQPIRSEIHILKLILFFYFMHMFSPSSGGGRAIIKEYGCVF